VTFGTVLGHMTIAARVYRTALEAVAGLDARVLLTLGRRFDRSTLGPVPPNVHVEAWVDQADVLDRADLVVCHGGSGTAFGALAAGVPLVVVSLFADQPENGRRIAAAGAGLVVDEADEADEADDADGASAITAAARSVLATPSYREAAGRMAAEMAAAPTAGDVLASVSDDVRR
jgi:MGT family glycosyltransferase